LCTSNGPSGCDSTNFINNKFQVSIHLLLLLSPRSEPLLDVRFPPLALVEDVLLLLDLPAERLEATTTDHAVEVWLGWRLSRGLLRLCRQLLLAEVFMREGYLVPQLLEALGSYLHLLLPELSHFPLQPHLRALS